MFQTCFNYPILASPGGETAGFARRGSRGEIDMRWQVTWPDSVAGWCFWASLVALIGVIGVMFMGAAVTLTSADGTGEVLLLVLEVGFAGVVGLFLLGIVSTLVRGIRGEREGERESKARTGLEATTAAAATAFPLERAGTVRVAAGMTGEGLEMTDSAETERLCKRLRETDVFDALTDHELRLVAGVGEVRPIVAGTRLAHAGHRGDTLYVILEGQVRLLARGGDGEVPVRVAEAGETVPLAVILDPPVLVTSVEAITDGEVLTIPRLKLLALCELQPMLGLHLYRAAAKVFEQRYRKTLERVTDGLRKALELAAAGAELAS